MVISQNLRNASSVMAWLSLSGAVLLTIAVPLAFLVPNPSFAFGGSKIAVAIDDLTGAVPLFDRALALLVLAVPLGCLIASLVLLFFLFRRYAVGSVFDVKSLRALRWITTLLFCFALLRPVALSINMYLFHLYLGQRWIGFKFDTQDFGMTFLAGVALVISRVMAEAKKLADENANFV
ncbi:hypothetical protein FHS83_001461 [Rhizomicrobium palustre]|uniref:DUF2975 domain-containing protein n=1 Tax=Rhizomicrobium palustre TaxID=189966 RepID=A0A846MXX7_9PROT|nr:DUF2975 domain-containing protein [Rhizomicrobium palustre]NIK88143.1 hypothetical protein [Rhizomicrobium palustre]